MNLTEALKAYLREKFGLKADASDDEARALVSTKLASGELATEKFAELNKAPDKASAVGAIVDQRLDAKLAPINATLERLVAQLSKAPEAPAEKKSDPNEDAGIKEAQANLDRMVEAALAKAQQAMGKSSHAPFDIFSKSLEPRVKSVAEQYSMSKSALLVPTQHKDGRRNTNPQAGQQLIVPGKGPAETDSQLDLAIRGAWLKNLARKHWRPELGELPGKRMSDHEAQLLEFAAHEMAWTGFEGRVDHSEEVAGQKLTDSQRHMVLKELIDDSTSGGQYLNLSPEVFDDMVVTVPLLYGELFPLVNLTVLPRGKSVRTPTMSNVTVNSGPTEGPTAGGIALQSTAGFWNTVDTNIFNATGACEVGADFMEDSLIDVGRNITEQYGFSFLAWLERVIAIGNGSTEPTGLFNTSGTVICSGANGTAGPFLVGDFEQLLFGVDKATRQAMGAKNVFVGTDTTYRRARAVSVSSTDQRRIFGYDHMAYTLFDQPFKIQNGIGSQQLAHVNMGYYRMWRRRGLTTRIETAGRTLALNNTVLIVIRARFGGRLMRGAAMAQLDNAPNSG